MREKESKLITYVMQLLRNLKYNSFVALIGI